MSQPSAEADYIARYRAETERLGFLVKFVDDHLPLVGIGREGHHAEVEIPPELERARTKALKEALDSIERVSRMFYLIEYPPT